MDNDNGNSTNINKRSWIKALRVAAWTVGILLILTIGLVVGVLTFLTSDRLTPIAEKYANEMLNADVTLGSVDLSLRRSFPFMNLDIDSLTLISRDIRNLPQSVRDTLPQWGDTLLAVDKMHGGINIFKLLGKIIDLKDLELYRPRVNILVVNDSLNNFSIVPPSDTSADTTQIEVPDIRLNRFSLISPEPIRYTDITQKMRLVAHIISAELSNQPDADAYLPQYRIDFASDISSPLLEIIGQYSMPLGLNGIVEWNHTEPYDLILKDFDFRISIVSGRINTKLNFYNELLVKSCDFKFDPLSVADFLAMVPDSLAVEYSIPKDMVTNAKMDISGKLLHPYLVGSTDLPIAQMTFSIPDCKATWEKMEMHKMALQALIDFPGGSVNDTRIEVDRLTVEGPGADFEIKGNISDIFGDPLFEGEVDGHLNLACLPSLITDNIHASMSGDVAMNSSVKIRPSMFSRANFHKLCLTGEAKVKDFYYLSDDTLHMFYVGRTDLHFGTHERFENRKGEVTDSLLTAKVAIDTAKMLVSGFDMRVGRLSLGIGAENKNAWTDTTAIIPMGGNLKVGTFSFFALSDTAGMKMREIGGRLTMKRYKDDAHLPLFLLNLGIGKMSAGDNHTRFVVTKSHLKAQMARLPETQLTKSRREVRHIADSISQKHPELSVDSVYIMATEIRRRNRRPGHHRVHSETNVSDQEIIAWGTSHVLTQLLLDWEISGTLTADKARLFTPSFPVRNRVDNLNIAFNNDSLSLTNVKYKAGASDFLISGNVTNMKRAFTSKRYRSPLKINFDLLSDFVDVNELSQAFFSGAAAEKSNTSFDTDDETLEQRFEQDIKEAKDTIAPLLIPVNIDAELQVKANHVAYSDFILNDFEGTVLMYDGALNLHDLRASSNVGKIDITALYSAQTVHDIDFGFGMQLSDFNIRNFLNLVPAVDSIMPMLRNLSGIISANLALTTKIDHNMDLSLPTLHAAIKLQGDSISFIDTTTFHKVSKWLLFKNKERNMINHISAEMIVENGQMRIFPFIFDFDRYKLGVQGYNDFDKNFNYHIAVLKSPIPFKFGINIKGDYDKLKIRFGGAKFNEKSESLKSEIVDTTRINLINQFQNVFKRGVRNSRFARLNISEKPLAQEIDLATDTLTSADSLLFKQEGLIPDDRE